MTDGTEKPVECDVLVSRLDEQGVLSSDEAIPILVQLAEQVETLHSADLWHGGICPDSVLIPGSGTVSLMSPEDDGPVELELDSDWYPSILRDNADLKIPHRLTDARQVLKAAGIEIDPVQVDVYQLGVLLCRLLTGTSLQHYLQSPRTKGALPPALATIIDRTLGFHEAGRFSSSAELGTALSALMSASDSTAQHVVVSAAPDDDTSPSIVSSSVESDTSVANEGRSLQSSNTEGLPFSTLGHYEIIDRIGHGGMGDVYRAFERSLDRTVAIKVLPAELSRDQDFVRRFYAEATAAARLSHPNVIDIYFIGEDQGHHFFAMQYVEGESLADLLSQDAKLPLDQALTIVTQTLSGLAAAHRKGLVHRDIKPGNILIDRHNRRCVVADFGLVKSLQASGQFTATGMVMGTVDYISPEQGRGQNVDARSDLYSVGVLLFRVLSGRLPFQADSPTAMIFQHVYEQPLSLGKAAPEVPAVISAIVEKLLAKDPNDRYGSASDVLLDLRAFREQSPLPSGADIVSADDDGDSGIVALDDAPGTIIIEAPRFGDEPESPENLDDAAPTGVWGRFRNRVVDAVEERAPEFIGYLQNTQQQVDRAVDVYEKRQRNLKQLVGEAEAVLQELQEQADEWRGEASNQSTEGEGHARQQLAVVDEQLTEQREQLESMQLRLAQVTSKLEKLRSQRDILNARLQVAEARLRVAGGKVAKRRVPFSVSWLPRLRWTRTTQAIVAVAAVCLVAATSYGVYSIYAPATPEISQSELKETEESVEETFELPEGITVKRFPLQVFAGQQQAVTHATFSDDGRLVAAADSENGFKIWDAKTAQLKRVLDSPSGTITHGDGLFINSDSRFVAGTPALWDLDTGFVRRSLPPERSGSRYVFGFSKDNKSIITLDQNSQDDVSFVHYPVEPDEQPDRWELPGSFEPGTIVRCAFSDVGNLLAITDKNDRVHVWDIAQRTELQSFQGLGTSLTAVKLAFSRDGSLLAALEPRSQKDKQRKQRVIVFDMKAGRVKFEIEPLRGTFDQLLAFDHSGEKLALTSSARIDGDLRDFVDVWDLRLGYFRLTLGGMQGISALAFSPDDRHLLVGGWEPKLSLWDLAMGPIERPLQTQRTIRRFSVCYSRDSLVYAYRDFVGVAPLGDLTKSREFSKFPGTVTTMDVSVDGRVAIAGGGAGTVCAYDVATGSILRTMSVVATARARGASISEPANYLKGVSFGNDSRFVLIGTSDKLLLWDLQTGAEIDRFAGGGTSFVSIMSPDGRYAATGEWNSQIRMGEPCLYDVESGRLVRRFIGHEHYVKSAAFSPDSKRLLTGGKGTVHVWDVETGEQLQQLTGNNQYAWYDAVAFSPDGRLAAGDARGKTTVWDTRTGEVTGRYEGQMDVLSMAFSEDSRQLIASDEGAVLRLWPIIIDNQTK